LQPWRSHEERLSRYFSYVEKTLKEISVKACGELRVKVEEVIDYAKRYYEDAKHYMKLGDYSTSYVCIAYCEGLLDSLKLLGLVDVR